MKVKMPTLNTTVQALSAAVLLGGPFYFGYKHQPSEMGLVIVAGALGLAFSNLDKFSEFSGAGFSAKMRDQIKAVINKETEPEKSDSAHGITVKAYGLDENTEKVVKALGNSRYTWRTVSGISQESGLPKREITRALSWLSLNNLIVKAESKDRANWGLSEDGRDLYNQIAATSAENP